MVKGPPESSGFRPPAGQARPRVGGSANALLPQRKRLRHADFQRVYQQGRRYFAAHMTVFFLPRDWGKGVRVGFTVGRVLGGSVERNRIRRRLREAVRVGAPAMEHAVDVVINPRKSVLTAEFAALRAEVAQAFEKIRSSLSATTLEGKGSPGKEDQ